MARLPTHQELVGGWVVWAPAEKIYGSEVSFEEISARRGDLT